MQTSDPTQGAPAAALPGAHHGDTEMSSTVEIRKKKTKKRKVRTTTAVSRLTSQDFSHFI